MKLLTKTLLKQFEKNKKLPELEQKVIAHYFNPTGAGDWYAITYDEETKMFFGYAHILEGEYGYFSLTELEGYTGVLGLGIERDLYFTSCDRSEIRAIR
mgnify:CR=1 FL=1